MATTVNQHQLAAFTTPVNGTSPIDATQVTGNDNTTGSTYNLHDADPGIHVQNSVVASRPAAGTAGRLWFTTDELRFYFDNGSSWVNGGVTGYLPLSGGTLTGGLIGTTGSFSGALGGLSLTATAGTVTATQSGISVQMFGGGGVGFVGTTTNHPLHFFTNSGADLGGWSTGGVFSVVGTATVGTTVTAGAFLASGSTGVSPGTAGFFYDASAGLVINTKSGSASEILLQNNGGQAILTVAVGTKDVVLGGSLAVATTLAVNDGAGAGQAFAVHSAAANGVYSTYLNASTPIGDIGSGRQLIGGGGATTDFAIASRTGKLILATQGSVPAITIASASTIVTFASGLVLSGGTGAVAGSLSIDATSGLLLSGKTGSTDDMTFLNGAGNVFLENPTGTTNANVRGNFSVATNKFTVAAASGNTVVGGTFTAQGSFVIDATGQVNVGNGNLTLGPGGSPTILLSNTTGNYQSNGYVASGVTGLVNGGGQWRFGTKVTAAATVDLTHYVEVSIGGTLVKLVVST